MQALIQLAFVQHDADPSQFPPQPCLLFEFNQARVSNPDYVEYVRGRLFDTFASTGNKSNDVHVYPTWRDFDPEAVGMSQIWPESPWLLFISEFRACFENRLDADDNDFSMCVGKYFTEHGCHMVRDTIMVPCVFKSGMSVVSSRQAHIFNHSPFVFQVQVRVTKACSGDVPTTVSVGVVDEGEGVAGKGLVGANCCIEDPAAYSQVKGTGLHHMQSTC